ncbi:MAG TPA: chemotaxis protein CheD [Luteitalea sp.]|nr:chemotaxis protein CheD [Luteitalea sp.]
MMSSTAASSRVVVGIGEFAVTEGETSIVTHALGSCIAVCIWDPVVRVGGMLHLLLPESRINPDRAERQPAAFADTGIPLLFQRAYTRGLQKPRTQVTLVGGAEISQEATEGVMNVGRRNILAARKMLWGNGVLIRTEDVGGRRARTVAMSLQDGRIVVTAAGEPARTL